MKRTTRAIRNPIPVIGNRSEGEVQLITMPAPPWEQPVSRKDAHQAAKASGYYVRNHFKQEASE